MESVIYCKAEVYQNSKGKKSLKMQFKLTPIMKKMLIIDMVMVGLTHSLAYYFIFNCILAQQPLILLSFTLLFTIGTLLLNYQNIQYLMETRLVGQLVMKQVTMLEEASEIDKEEVPTDWIPSPLVKQSLVDVIEQFKWVVLRTVLLMVAEMGLVFGVLSYGLGFLAVLLLTLWKGAILFLLIKNHQAHRRLFDLADNVFQG